MTDDRGTGLSRRGFIGGGAALAAGAGTILATGMPAFGADPGPGPDGFPVGPSDGGVSAQLAPTIIAGATVKSLPLAAFITVGISNNSLAWLNVVASSGAYSDSGFAVVAPLDLPVGATLKQLDCYGVRTTVGTQAWNLIDQNLVTGSATTALTGTSLSTTGAIQTTMTPSTVVANGHGYMVSMFPSASDNVLNGVIYQYLPPTRGYVAVDPFRAYDSRWPGGFGRMLSGTNRGVGVNQSHDLGTGATIDPNRVPLGAIAVTYNVTLADTAGSGFLAVVPGDATSFTASTINWFTDGQILANGGTVGINSFRTVKVFSGGPGNTDFLIDVTGYYI
jgi:hypothetical protein